MIGQNGNRYRFVPVFHCFVNRSYGTFVEILDREKFQVDIPFVPRLIAGFNVKINKIVRFQGFQCGSYFILVIRIIKPGRPSTAIRRKPA